MPIEYELFETYCNTRGYKAKDQRLDKTPANIFSTYTRNNVKVEVKVTRNKACYAAGFGLNDYKLNFLKVQLEDKGMVVLQRMAKFLKVQISNDVIDGFNTLVTIIENIDELIQRHRASRFYEAQYDDSVFMYVATDINNMLKYKPPGSPWSRGKIFDDIDKMITIGYSQKGMDQELNGKAAYREHIVPIDWCISKAFNMYQNGSSIKEVAQMFKRNIFVARISDEEQYLLDNKLGLRTTMPEGFDDGDDPMARLNAAGIKIIDSN